MGILKAAGESSPELKALRKAFHSIFSGNTSSSTLAFSSSPTQQTLRGCISHVHKVPLMHEDGDKLHSNRVCTELRVEGQRLEDLKLLKREDQHISCNTYLLHFLSLCIPLWLSNKQPICLQTTAHSDLVGVPKFGLAGLHVPLLSHTRLPEPHEHLPTQHQFQHSIFPETASYCAFSIKPVRGK